MHARMMRHQQRMLKKLQNSTAEKKAENQELDKQLKELQVSVTERQQIDDLAGKLVLKFLLHYQLLLKTQGLVKQKLGLRSACTTYWLGRNLCRQLRRRLKK